MQAVRDKISEKGLKVTPQRVKVLEAIYKLKNHPTADQIIGFIHKTDPNIGSGTVYNVLDVLVKNQIIRKVKTDKDVMRYDGILEDHHHLYCKECDYIEDFVSEKLDKLLKDFFSENPIDNFIIDDLKLQIGGNFIVHKKQEH